MQHIICDSSHSCYAARRPRVEPIPCWSALSANRMRGDGQHERQYNFTGRCRHLPLGEGNVGGGRQGRPAQGFLPDGSFLPLAGLGTALGGQVGWDAEAGNRNIYPEPGVEIYYVAGYPGVTAYSNQCAGGGPVHQSATDHPGQRPPGDRGAHLPAAGRAGQGYGLAGYLGRNNKDRNHRYVIDFLTNLYKCDR